MTEDEFDAQMRDALRQHGMDVEAGCPVGFQHGQILYQSNGEWYVATAVADELGTICAISLSPVKLSIEGANSLIHHLVDRGELAYLLKKGINIADNRTDDDTPHTLN